jgi:hypothetical protein
MSGVSALPEVTEVLLAEAAVFLARDQGADGFLDRFAEAVTGDPRTASLALDRALAARARAGYVAFRLEPGDLRVESTSSGASLTACALPGRDGFAAAVRLVDAARRPVAGAAMQVTTESEDRVVVTDLGGWVHLSEPGQTLHIQLGQLGGIGQLGQAGGAGGIGGIGGIGGAGGVGRVGEARGRADPEPAGSPAAGASVIPLPRSPRPDGLELAAAHEEAVRAADEPARWRVSAGGVDFLCLARKGGYDITVLLTDVTADFADGALGEYAVRFLTLGRNGREHRWMVPLGPSPLGLAGSLYSTDEDRLDAGSVEVRVAEQLIATLGDHLDEVVSRSVRHSDALTAWDVLCQRLRPGRPRAVLEAALAERANFS